MRRTALVLVALLAVTACTAAPPTTSPTTVTGASPTSAPGGGSPTAVALAMRAAEFAPKPETVTPPQLEAVARPEAGAGATSLVESAQAELVLPCDLEGVAKTLGDEGPAELAIRNETQASYALFELDVAGARQHRADLPPGETFTQSTFESHPWLVARASQCAAIIIPPARIRISPSQEPGPSPTGGLFGPTPSAVPPAAGEEELLRASMLTADELPANLSLVDSAEFDDDHPAYAENGGLLMGVGKWASSGTGAVSVVVDLRGLFESPDGAAGYLEARLDELAETDSGMRETTDVDPVGENGRVFYGRSQPASGPALDHWIFLFTSGPFVGKVYVRTVADLDPSTARGIADAAAARSATAGGDGGGGSEDPFPSAAENDLLSHVPEAIATRCHRSGEQAEGAEASVACPLTGGPAYITYVQFDSKSSMDAYFAETVEATPEATGDSCQSGPAHTTWGIGGTQYGEVICADAGGSAYIEWTDDRVNIDSFASHAELDFAGLYDFWANEAGPNP